MLDIGTLIEVCNMLENGMNAIKEGKDFPYTLEESDLAPISGLDPLDYSAYDALYQFKLFLEKGIESQIGAMEMEYGE